MRKHLLTVIVAGFLFAVASTADASATPKNEADTAAAPAPVAVQRIAVPSTGLRDEAAMVLVGTALIGLGAAVRRAG